MAFVFLIVVFFIDHFAGGYLISIAYCPFFIHSLFFMLIIAYSWLYLTRCKSKSAYLILYSQPLVCSPPRLIARNHVIIPPVNEVYRVYSFCLFHVFVNFFLAKNFVAFFSATVRPTKLKFGTHVDNGWMYRVYQNQVAGTYLSLYFSFSPVFKHYMFSSHSFQERQGLQPWK